MNELRHELRPTPAVETQPKGEELTVLSQVESADPVEAVNFDQALERLEELRTHLDTQHAELIAGRSSHREQWEEAREWLKQVDGVEMNVVRLNIRIDALLTKFQKLEKDAFSTDLMEEFLQLEQNSATILAAIEQLQIETAKRFAVEDESSDGITIHSAGAMADKWKVDAKYKEARLGQSGEDVMFVDQARKTGVLVDGTSTMPDSFIMAQLVGHQTETTLQTVDEELADSMDEIKWFIEGDIDDILAQLDSNPNLDGACTEIAIRYFSKFDSLAMIHIGDCEGVIVVEDEIYELTRRINTTTSDTIEKLKGRNSEFMKPTVHPLVQTFDLAPLRQRHPGKPLHVILSTDGVKNNTGKPLRESAQEIVVDGPKTFIKKLKDRVQVLDVEVGFTKETEKKTFPVPLADDMELFHLIIPASQEMAASGESVAA